MPGLPIGTSEPPHSTNRVRISTKNSDGPFRPLNERAMKQILLLPVLSILVLAACGSRGTGQTCTWQASDDPSPLDLQDQGQGLHLMSEAVLVEDLAVRYADFHRGHRSGHFAGIEAYHQTREQCMAMLFEIVANHHGVSTGQVRDALVYRRTSVDLFVLAVFVVFYIAVANAIVRSMFHSVPSDGPWLRSLATAVTACGVGAGGVVLFGLYSATYEMIRIGNTHMSYRGGRSPWNQHQGELLVGGVILFALVAAYRHARDRAESRESQTI